MRIPKINRPKKLILDAKAAPIGDISLNDPNWFHENKPKY